MHILYSAFATESSICIIRILKQSLPHCKPCPSFWRIYYAHSDISMQIVVSFETANWCDAISVCTSQLPLYPCTYCFPKGTASSSCCAVTVSSPSLCKWATRREFAEQLLCGKQMNSLLPRRNNVASCNASRCSSDYRVDANTGRESGIYLRTRVERMSPFVAFSRFPSPAVCTASRHVALPSCRRRRRSIRDSSRCSWVRSSSQDWK